MKKEKNVYNEIQPLCHPGSLLTGVSLGYIRKGNEQVVCIGKETAGDPGQKPSGMTTLLNELSGHALTYKGVSPSPLVGEDARRAGEGFSRGFTLIELLVVVLIIGILAAVALPQYQLAVAKSRVNRLLPIMKSIEQAQEVYKMEHGNYTGDFSRLDVKVGNNSDIICTPGINGKTYTSVYCRDTKVPVNLERYYHVHYTCWASSDDISQNICKHLCQTKKLSTSNKCIFTSF